MRTSAPLLLLVAVAYAATASRWVLGEDNAEFVTLFADGGVAHPSGYPVYTLYLRAAHGLLFSLPAPLGASLATAAISLLAVAALYRACLAFGASRDGARFASGLFAVAPLTWSLSTRAEVFAPNALFAALLLWLCAPDAPLAPARRAGALGLVAGLALGNHLSIVLLAPLGVSGLSRAVARSPSPARALALALLGLLVGLSSYLSIPYAAQHIGARWMWGDPSDLRGLLHHILRGDYGAATLSPGAHRAEPLRQLSVFAASFAAQWLFAPVAIGLWSLGLDLRDALRRAPDAPRLHTFALALSLVAAGPFFVSLFNIPPSGIGALVVARFHLLPLVLFAPWVARGADRLSRPLRPALARGAMLALVLASCARSLPGVLDEHPPTLERYATDTLSLTPPRAILLTTGDHRTFSLLYAQRALGLRRDVTLLAPMLLLVDGNRRRYARSLGVELPAPVRQTVDMPDVIQRLLATGRPVFATDPIAPGLMDHFSVYPVGPLLRVLPRGSALPPPDVLEQINLEARRRSHLGRADETSTGWFAIVYQDWARPWESLALAYDRLGQPDRARLCRQRARITLGRAP